jgi:murein DD-endopeptidase MepM/ murein hydrolase activator NlpD
MGNSKFKVNRESSKISLIPRRALWQVGKNARRLLRTFSLFVFFGISIFAPSDTLPFQKDPALEWHQLYTRIRDGLISKPEAQSRIKSLETMLKESYPGQSGGEDEKPLCFPLEGYGFTDIGGKGGTGYQARGYDFFDGNRHGGHPGHDIFIRDRDRDGLDDATERPVNVISCCSGIVVSTRLGWEPSSPIRGGNYVWIYESARDRYYYYAHLNEILAKIGQIVARGQRIGTVGRTGKNAYPKRSPTHLHFTVHHSVEGTLNPVNPYKELVGGGCR